MTKSLNACGQPAQFFRKWAIRTPQSQTMPVMPMVEIRK